MDPLMPPKLSKKDQFPYKKNQFPFTSSDEVKTFLGLKGTIHPKEAETARRRSFSEEDKHNKVTASCEKAREQVLDSK